MFSVTIHDIVEYLDIIFTQADQVNTINLQIGGLVTSMHRSFLSDVSPPVSVLMESSTIDQMGNSLITSSDFANIDEFFGDEDTLNSAQFNRYTLNDAIKDRHFLEKLTTYDDSLFTKDADIEKTDVNQILGNLSGNSTLQSSMSSSSHTTKNDETFTPNGLCNGTFNAVDAEGDRTFLHILSTSKQNNTFELSRDAVNTTFDAGQKSNPFVPFHSKTIDLLENESMLINETFGVASKTFSPNATINLPRNGGEQLTESPADSPVTKANLQQQMDGEYLILSTNFNENDLPQWIWCLSIVDICASTPSRQIDITKNLKNVISKIDLNNISPIMSDELQSRNKYADRFRENESPSDVAIRQFSGKKTDQHLHNYGLQSLRDEERRSLANFEEFENTLSLLESNRDEKELDDLLNSFDSAPKPVNEKIRQSLDNIKKRQSLINLEKQEQDEMMRRMEASLNRSGGETNTTILPDRQRMNDSINKLMMSSSGSGERLLRRSRLYDDAIPNNVTATIDDNNVIKSSILNETISQTENNNKTSDIQGSGLDNEQLNSTYAQHSQNGMEKTENAWESNEPEVDKSNRDRFKTIRIFKRPPENAKMVPDYNEDNDAMNDEYIPAERKLEHFTAKNTNSPKALPEPTEVRDSRRASSVSGIKRSGLARPTYLSGLAKRESTFRSSSQEILGSTDKAEPAKNPPAALKSPMGIKAKSIHNLSGNIRSAYSNQTQVCNTKIRKFNKWIFNHVN